jgi:uncharacterized membrane protein
VTPGTDQERGSASVLVVGLFVVGLMLVVVVVDASAAYLRRQQLHSVADGAALAAADGVQGAQVYEGGLGATALIDPAVARTSVVDYLASTSAASRYPGLRWSVRTTADSVVVTVQAPLDLPFSPPGWTESTTVTGTAASFVVVGE